MSQIRDPAVAGLFYPDDPIVLQQQLEDFLSQQPRVKTRPKALIVPHAGYIYSGPVAAHAYRLVQGKEYESVIVVSVSHSHGFSGGSIYPKGGYQTPLGIAEIDEALARERAGAVLDYLLTRSVPSYRLVAVSYGELFPDQEATAEQNRRIEFEVGP